MGRRVAPWLAVLLLSGLAYADLRSRISERAETLALPTASRCEGELTPSEVRAILAARSGDVFDCYAEATQRGVTGEYLELRLRISDDGRVFSVGTTTDIGDQGFVSCVTSRAHGWSVERPAAGECASVRLPFVLGR